MTRTEKGASLARGPALILGTILTAVGLYLLYKAHTFAHFSSFPNGHAHTDGKFLFGLFGANGWTGMLTAVAGGLLLFGAAQHVLAKLMSLIVGVALAAAAIIGFTSSGNVVGMAAANHLTELGWAVSALILLFNTLVPRRTRTVEVPGGAVAGDEYGERGGTRGLPRERARRHEAEAAAAGGAAGAVWGEHHERKRERQHDAEAPTTVNDRADAPVDERGAGTAGTAGTAGAAGAAGAGAAGQRTGANGEPAAAGGQPANAAAQGQPANANAEGQPANAAAQGQPANDANAEGQPANAAAQGQPANANAEGQPANAAPANGTPAGDRADAGQTGTHRTGGLLGRLRGDHQD